MKKIQDWPVFQVLPSLKRVSNKDTIESGSTVFVFNAFNYVSVDCILFNNVIGRKAKQMLFLNCSYESTS